MGEDTDAASTAGGKLLSEVQKVLDPSEGHYLCVTLGQPHVLGKLTVYAALAATDNCRQARVVLLTWKFCFLTSLLFHMHKVHDVTMHPDLSVS